MTSKIKVIPCSYPQIVYVEFVAIRDGYCENGYDCLSYCKYVWPPALCLFTQQLIEQKIGEIDRLKTTEPDIKSVQIHT